MNNRIDLVDQGFSVFCFSKCCRHHQTAGLDPRRLEGDFKAARHRLRLWLFWFQEFHVGNNHSVVRVLRRKGFGFFTAKIGSFPNLIDPEKRKVARSGVAPTRARFKKTVGQASHR